MCALCRNRCDVASFITISSYIVWKNIMVITAVSAVNAVKMLRVSEMTYCVA